MIKKLLRWRKENVPIQSLHSSMGDSPHLGTGEARQADLTLDTIGEKPSKGSQASTSLKKINAYPMLHHALF